MINEMIIDGQSTFSGRERPGLEEGWLKALEKAHYENQRESMAFESGGASGSDNPQGEGPGAELEDRLPPDSELRHRLAPNSAFERSTFVATPESQPLGTRSPSNSGVNDLALNRLNSLPGTVLVPMSPTTSGGVSKDTRGQAGEPSAPRFATITTNRESPNQSLKLLPHQSGLELVIRSREGLSGQIARTVKAIESFLALNNQKLSSVRINGEVWQEIPEAADEAKARSDGEANNVNKIY